ncbi:MAG TPA: hypothetical protein EYH15_03130 [Methanothermococcus okinawensis]|uniref:Uncharacterized protein n=1 Tax=Methanothermococcus okinawensis TaxID=155863 RepID=A0A832ZQM8_9EURY|nr:hypothetical protein [Methanococcaceae archaeon]HIP84462.1 hypothetical protein [Methanothermococcus okinawensis]HIP90728.1 hypothetical protein [Methanothermococcus okinawensis]
MRLKVGVTRMYRDVIEGIGVEDFSVVNPYREKLRDKYSLLVISKGYRDKVKKLNPFPIFEIPSATFKDLTNSVKGLTRLNIGSPEKIEGYLKAIEEKEKYIKSLNINRDIEVNPVSLFIEKVVLDLAIPVSKEGIPLVPDYMAHRYRGEVLILKTHRYYLNTLERVEDRYLSLINLLNSL